MTLPVFQHSALAALRILKYVESSLRVGSLCSQVLKRHEARRQLGPHEIATFDDLWNLGCPFPVIPPLC